MTVPLSFLSRGRVVYNYYRRLNRRQRRVYDRSDSAESVPLPRPERHRTHVRTIHAALTADDRAAVEQCCNRLCATVTASLNVAAPRVLVKAKRPSRNWGELHGLYQSTPGSEPPVITVWMRTAKRRQVVAVRTFLRTLLHELCHHLDYVHLRLPESFHTEGFYKRESSLFQQLTRDADLPARRRTATHVARTDE